MEISEAKAAISKPQVNRLKDLGMGWKMGRVFGTRVLIQPIEAFTEMDRVKKAGLLVIPETVEQANKPKPCTGIVLQLGDELLKQSAYNLEFAQEQPTLKIGDGVMYSKYSGTEFFIEQVEYRMLEFKEIMCTLEVVDDQAYGVVTD